MSLIECPDCGKQISPYAEFCPDCGCPKWRIPCEQDSIVILDGRCVFGRYGDGDIEWRVLEMKNSSALLISERAIESKPYQATGILGNIVWSNCSLRTWLNGEFLNTAFDDAERARIHETVVATDDNPFYDMSGGPATRDRVFCLSIEEVCKYFAKIDDRVCYPTAYAEANGAWTEGLSRGGCRWWLRSPANNGACVADVGGSGQICDKGHSASDPHNGIRPALWVNLR